ncbi:hypothetical protein [Clavibacter michiganensis]|uniref:Uncharacterized protein n=1 Tax=Clavibacter michiganensis TaxID=28447 RepID=A0A251YT86_9MICO|nr:hypothetical protein [Clavibacter michiganensis]OUE27343.1 hypothetical protein BFL37_04445 [Clavibacter michiganensis]
MSSTRFAAMWVLAYAVVTAFSVASASGAHRYLVATLSGPPIVVTTGLGVSVARRRRREPPP